MQQLRLSTMTGPRFAILFGVLLIQRAAGQKAQCQCQSDIFISVDDLMRALGKNGNQQCISNCDDSRECSEPSITIEQSCSQQSCGCEQKQPSMSAFCRQPSIANKPSFSFGQKSCGCQPSISIPNKPNFSFGQQSCCNLQPSFEVNQPSISFAGKSCGCQPSFSIANKPSFSIGQESCGFEIQQQPSLKIEKQPSCGCNQQQPSFAIARQPSISIGQQCGCGNQQCGCGYQQCGCGKQQCGCGKQQCGCGKQQCGCGKQQCGCGNQQCGCGNQQCGCGNQQWGCGNQQCGCGNQQCGCGKQQCDCGNQQCLSMQPTLPRSQLPRQSFGKNQKSFSINKPFANIQQQESNQCWVSELEVPCQNLNVDSFDLCHIENKLGGAAANALQQAPPFGVYFEGEDLIIDGAVQVCGSMPFSSIVEVSGRVPASGSGCVQYECNDFCDYDN